jgi:hypothetical protein
MNWSLTFREIAEFEVLRNTLIKLFPGLFPTSTQAINLFLAHFNIIVLCACQYPSP